MKINKILPDYSWADPHPFRFGGHRCRRLIGADEAETMM
jgi:hypothetical protein